MKPRYKLALGVFFLSWASMLSIIYNIVPHLSYLTIFLIGLISPIIFYGIWARDDYQWWRLPLTAFALGGSVIWFAQIMV